MLSIRPAKIEDANFLWVLRNDVAIRNASYNRKAISIENYQKELSEIVTDLNNTLFVVYQDKIGDVGFVSLKPKAVYVEIQVGIGTNDRGKGYGQQTIRLATTESIKVWKDKPVRARIRQDNYKAIFCFESCGYKDTSPQDTDGPFVLMEFSNAAPTS